MEGFATLYRNYSSDSELIDAELLRRHVSFRRIWVDGAIRELPAVQYKGVLIEGVNRIESEFFRMLENSRPLPR